MTTKDNADEIWLGGRAHMSSEFVSTPTSNLANEKSFENLQLLYMNREIDFDNLS